MAYNSKDTAAFQGVWVFCEQRDGVILGTGYQLLSEGRKLADDLGVELCGVLLGSDAMGGLSTDKWAPAYAKGTDAEGFPADAVLLVLYYNENGSPKDANPVENIKRIGFVHITSVDF